MPQLEDRNNDSSHRGVPWRRRKDDPSTRRRGRTISAEPEVRLKTDEQPNCFLFKKLPVELRMMIYRQILSSFGQTQHIAHEVISKKKTSVTRLWHSTCIGEVEAYISRDLQRYWGPWGFNHSSCQRLPSGINDSVSNGAPVLALLQSCRRV
jgi:hypothetical protein